MQKFAALCILALCAFASAMPSDFNNDVILKGRRAAKAVAGPCKCFSSKCKITAPSNGGVGDCESTLASGSTCIPTCNTGYTKSGTTFDCTNGKLTNALGVPMVPTCVGKKCTISKPADVLPTGATGAAPENCAGTMNSGSFCDFACPVSKVRDTKTTCANALITLGSCKASYCDAETVAISSDGGVESKANGGAGGCSKTQALDSSCTPKFKSGYTCAGKVTCPATSPADTLQLATEDVTCTANSCTGITAAPTNGLAGDCLATLASGAAGCTPTCDAGYTKSIAKRTCTAGVLTDVTCVAPCTAADINAVLSATSTANVVFTGAPSTMAGTFPNFNGTLVSGGTGTYNCKPNYTTGFTARLSCLAGKVTAGKCEADCATAAPTKPTDATANAALAGKIAPVAGAGGCDPATKLKGGTSCVWSNTFVAGYTCSAAKCKDGALTESVCSGKPLDSCTITQASGTKGNCNANAGTTNSGAAPCVTTCNTGFVTQLLETTCTNGVATCSSCHSSCKLNHCAESIEQGCTKCRDGYKLTANTAAVLGTRAYTFTTGTCTWATTYTSPVTFTQTAAFNNMDSTFFTANKDKLALGYGISLELATAVGWKVDCTGSASIVSRRATTTVSFSATSTAALAQNAAALGSELTAVLLKAGILTAGVTVNIASVGAFQVGSASKTGIVAVTAVAAMVAGLFWQ